MIQRIQSIWLLLAALASAGLLYFDLYHITTTTNNIEVTQALHTSGHYGLLLLALLMTALPLISIFMFKNRKQQRSLALLNIVVCAGFIAWMMMFIANETSKAAAPVHGSYQVGAVLPVLSVIFSFLAISGIRKDEKLVKSLDRLR